MPDDDDLLELVLAVAEREVAPRVTLIALGAPQRPNGPPLSDRAYVTNVVLNFREVLATRLLGLPQAEQARILALLQVGGDPALMAALLAVVANEAPKWINPEATAERNRALVSQLLGEFVQQRPDRLRQVVDAARAARNQRLGLIVANPLLRPVPIQGDPLAVELRRVGAGQIGLRVLRGYLGGQEVLGHRRLFRTLEFNEYVDIPEGAIVHTLDLRTAVNPLGGCVVWVTVGARLIKGSVGFTKPELEGRFLAGGIASSGGGMGGRGEWTPGCYGELTVGCYGELTVGCYGELTVGCYGAT